MSRTRARAPPLRSTLAGALACLLLIVAVPKAFGVTTAAPNAILVDHGTGSVLFEKNADAPSTPASLAKLMTIAVAFDEIRHHRLELDDELIVSETAWKEGGAASGGSSTFLPLGSRVKVLDLLRGIIVQSGNDASIVLAEGIAGSEGAFVQMMNAKAQELGLTGSHFLNSHGLPDPAQNVTPRDLAQLARYIIREHPDLYRLFAEREFTFNKIRQPNRNRLLWIVPGTDGLKTGYTNDSGYSLVGSAIREARRLIVVVMGLKSASQRTREARKLLEWGFRSFHSATLFDPGEIVAHARVYGGTETWVPLVTRERVQIVTARSERPSLAAKVTYRGPVEAPVREGDQIGKLRILQSGRPTDDVTLYAAKAVGPGSLPSRAWDAVTDLVLRHMPWS
jgi:serine-type D-Ala-D-Ala carboxypeptidase (penicillin-binding protein 5/6)